MPSRPWHTPLLSVLPSPTHPFLMAFTFTQNIFSFSVSLLLPFVDVTHTLSSDFSYLTSFPHLTPRAPPYYPLFGRLWQRSLFARLAVGCAATTLAQCLGQCRRVRICVCLLPLSLFLCLEHIYYCCCCYFAIPIEIIFVYSNRMEKNKLILLHIHSLFMLPIKELTNI